MAVTSREETRSFYEELAGWAAENGWLRLSFLRVGDQAVAFQYGFEARGTYYFLKGGYDPGAVATLLASCSFGLLEWAFETGLSRFDFLGADDPFKLEWSRTAYDLKLVQAFSRSPLGAAEWAAYAYGRPGPARALGYAACVRASTAGEVRVDGPAASCASVRTSRGRPARCADDRERVVVAAGEQEPGAPDVVIGGDHEELRPPAGSGELGDSPGLASRVERVGCEADHLDLGRFVVAQTASVAARWPPRAIERQRVGKLRVEKLLRAQPLPSRPGPENDDRIRGLGDLRRSEIDLEPGGRGDDECEDCEAGARTRLGPRREGESRPLPDPSEPTSSFG